MFFPSVTIEEIGVKDRIPRMGHPNILSGEKGMKRACLAIIVVAFTGCATSPEVTAWNMAKEVNTPAAYKDYVQRYPNSGNTDEARERIGKANIEQIMKADTVAECVRIMKTNSDPKTAATLADLAVKAVRKETSPDALYEFLDNFKGNAEADAVRSRLEEIEFKAASGDASPVAMEYFLFRYPGSRFAAQGRNLLSEKSYGQVKTWGNQYGFKAFLRMFPESPRAAEVRGWIKPAAPQAGSTGHRETLSGVYANSTWLKRYACAVSLSSKIRKHAGDADSLRRDLYDLEKGTDSGNLPGSCSSVTVATKPDAGESLDEVLRMMTRAEERRKELADQWRAYAQRDDMIRGAVGASLKVAEELETAELSEDVLGRGPLGGLDIGKEKGSESARKALERFRIAEKLIKRDKDEIRPLLVEANDLYKPMQFFVTSCLAAE